MLNLHSIFVIIYPLCIVSKCRVLWWQILISVSSSVGSISCHVRLQQRQVWPVCHISCIRIHCHWMERTPS